MFHFEAFNWLKPFYSESNSFLEIQHVEGELPCEMDQEVLVNYILDRNELEPGANHVVFYYLVSCKHFIKCEAVGERENNERGEKLNKCEKQGKLEKNEKTGNP